MSDPQTSQASPRSPTRVLITGAGSGIGREVALKLASAGAELLALVGRTRDSLEQTGASCQALGADLRCVVLEADVGDETQVQDAFLQLQQTTDRLDGLVNNAGQTHFAGIEQTSLEQWNQVLRTNLTGPFLVTRAALEMLRRSPHPAIVNVGSTVGMVGLKNAAAYCASKAGLLNLTRVLALDHAGEGIRVNAVAPGPVETAMVSVERGDGVEVQQVHAELERLHPLGRIAKPEEVAAVVEYLLSQDASFVTGSVVRVDGGLLAGFNR